MDKTIFYKKLDIESIDEFKYYENLASLMEEDDYIEENLVKDLIREVDKDVLAEHMESFFENFLKNLPDNETDLYITVESVKRMMEGLISSDMDDEDTSRLASEIVRFRKWYVHDLNVFDKLTRQEVNVRDARYNIVAAGFLGEQTDYDFRLALDYDVEGYDVRFSDMIDYEE